MPDGYKRGALHEARGVQVKGDFSKKGSSSEEKPKHLRTSDFAAMLKSEGKKADRVNKRRDRNRAIAASKKFKGDPEEKRKLDEIAANAKADTIKRAKRAKEKKRAKNAARNAAKRLEQQEQEDARQAALEAKRRALSFKYINDLYYVRATMRASVLLLLLGGAEVYWGLRYHATGTMLYARMRQGAWWCGVQAIAVALMGFWSVCMMGERAAGKRFFYANFIFLWTDAGLGCFSECSRWPDQRTDQIMTIAEISCYLCGAIGVAHLYAMSCSYPWAGAHEEWFIIWGEKAKGKMWSGKREKVKDHWEQRQQEKEERQQAKEERQKAKALKQKIAPADDEWQLEDADDEQGDAGRPSHAPTSFAPALPQR